MRNPILTLALLAVVITAIGCGSAGAGGGGGQQQDITVSLSPKTVSVAGDGTQALTATILNPNNRGVTWTLSGSGCTGSACGTLGNYGGNNNQGWTATYTAPLTVPSPATVTVTATSVDDTSKSDSATITITAPVVTVSVTPKAPTVILGATQQLTATVRGAANTAATWSTPGPGTVSIGGLYSAPATLTTPATATVTATSQADNTKSDAATVNIPAVAVSVSPPNASVIGGGTQQFVATVSNATNQAVTWSVTGLGSISSQGLYTAPALAPSQTTVTITATSVADPTKSGSATVTLIPISVTVSPATAMVVITGKKQFTATVAATSNTVVTWSVPGTGCSGDDCGTIGSNGHYVAPAQVPSSSVTVKATSLADPTKSGTASVQIMLNGDFKLNGNYALYFQGFDATGKMVASVGSMIADGAGHLTDGVYDQNGLSVTAGPHTMTGTYTVGPDNRGIFTKSTGEVFRFAINDTGDRGYFIEWDNSGVRGSGVFKKQTTTDFSPAKITGGYAFGFTGSGYTGERQGVVGRFTMDGAGNLTQGAFDSVMAVGGYSRVDSYTGSMVVNGSTGGTGYGRGTMSMIIPNAGTFHGVFYMVNATELFYISADPITASVPLLSGTMLTQSPPPFMISSMNGPAVFHVTGLQASMGLNTIMIGQWVANPNTATLTAEYAGNDSGSSIPLGNFTATYSIAVNGRGNFMPSTGGGFVYYMVGPNKAFLVSDDANVMTGMAEPQAIPAGGFTNASLLGDYFGGTIDRASTPVIDTSGVSNMDGVNTWTVTEDNSFPGGNDSDSTATATYSITSPTTGRGTLTVPGGNDIVFYAVSPTKFYNFVLYVPDRIAVNEQQ